MKAPTFTRINSGIPGLDEMIEGGFPFPSVILVAGGAGSGKTTFAQKFLFEGANKGEQGLFFTTLSEPTQWMLRFSSQFDFVNPEYYGTKIVYHDLGPFLRDHDEDELLEYIDEQIARVMPQRIVIDPITVVGALLDSDYRLFLYDLTTRLKNWQATSILTGEVPPNEIYPSEVSYAVDGVLLLILTEEEEARRKYIEILKLRGTSHTTGKQSIDISRKEGVVVLKARF
ncbi:MAG TPA: KaiA-binding protein [Euryarchaeota archaeon]|nr:KaiA-binding protein [Euryarchaeota archaeon]